MNHKIPEKPKTQKDQVSVMWDIMCNHLLSWAKWQDVKMRFIMAFLALIIALLGVLILKLF